MNRLKELRKSRKMTRVELAEKLGVTKLTILNWEHGTHEIKGSNAKKLADLFGVSIPHLLGYDTDNTFSDLITKINQWADERNLKQADPKIQWMRITEEVGEIRDVFLKPHDFVNPEWSLKDAIGDSIVTLIVLCLQLGYDAEECLTIAYNDIKDRKGVIIDDNFVKVKGGQKTTKEEDL